MKIFLFSEWQQKLTTCVITALLVVDLALQTSAQYWERNDRMSNHIDMFEEVGSGEVPVVESAARRVQGDRPRSNPLSSDQPRALTREQTALVERTFGKTWDRSHLLENIAGMEANCGMLRDRSWQFSKTQNEARLRNLDMQGIFEAARNKGETQDALQRALDAMRQTARQARRLTEVGCVLITNCYAGRGDIQSDFVLVTCIFGSQIRQL